MLCADRSGILWRGMSAAESMPSAEVAASVTALILASAQADQDAMVYLLGDRSHADLLAMLAYCVHFSTVWAAATKTRT